MYKNGVQNYRRTDVTTADPKRLVLMCYEGAIENLKTGKQSIIEKDYEGKCKALDKVRDIIEELLHSLEFEKGGIIAKNLDSLYNYMLRRLLDADLEKDMKAIDEVIGMLSELKSAWEEIFYKPDEEVQSEVMGSGEEKNEEALSQVSV